MEENTKRRIHVGLLCETFLRDWSGAERMLAGLAAEMLERGHRATILAKPPAGQVSPKIPLTPAPEDCGVLELDLDSPEGLARAKSDLLDAGLDVLVAPCTKRDFLKAVRLASDAGVPLVSAEAIHPAVLTHERWNAYEHYAALACCDRVQVLLEPFLRYYPEALQSRMDAIGNPAPPAQAVDWAARAAKSQKTLLGVGRFDERDKQFTLLLRTWALLAPEFPDWRLLLVGDGSSWDLYHAMVKAMGPNARAEIHGSVLDPGEFYAGADIFCMPSRQEGFGLVLGEAAAYGLPLVGLRSCEAASELIAPGCGALAEDSSPAALAEALRPLMSAPASERERLGRGAQEFFQTHYGAERVYDQWERTLLLAAEARNLPRLERLRRDHWDEALLNQAALELLSRPDPLGSPETCSGAAAMARLRGEYAALEKEHLALQKKYEALRRQGQTGKRGR